MRKTILTLLFLATVVYVPQDSNQVHYEVNGYEASAVITLTYIVPEKPQYEEILIKGEPALISY